jgi:hypothetical protein
VQEKLIDKIKLRNGLTLKVYDRSRPVAGDRWLVSFVARIDIEVRPEYFESMNTQGLAFEDIRAAVGEKVSYRSEKIRNFIAETEKDEVFRGLKDRFLGASLGYLSSPDFPRKLILREYQEAKGQRMPWKRQ